MPGLQPLHSHTFSPGPFGGRNLETGGGLTIARGQTHWDYTVQTTRRLLTNLYVGGTGSEEINIE